MQVRGKAVPVAAATLLSLTVGGCSLVFGGKSPEHKRRRLLPRGVKRKLGAVTWAKAFYTSARVMRRHFRAVKVDHKARVIESDTPIRDEARGSSRRIALLRLSRAGQNIIAHLYVGRYRWETERSFRSSVPCASCAGRRDSTQGNRAKSGRRRRKSSHGRDDCPHLGNDEGDAKEVLRSWGFQRKLAEVILDEIDQELDWNAPEARGEGPPAAAAE